MIPGSWQAKGLRAAVALGLAAGLVGCGGGGGGGGGAPQATLSVAQGALVFDAEQGETTASQTVAGSLTNVVDPVTVTIAYTTNGIATASFLVTGTTTGELTVTPRAAADLAPGVYDDTISVSACFDVQCLRQTAGSPRQVSVRYTVRRAAPPPVLQASQRGVGLAVVPGGQRTQHRLTITEPTGTAAAWTASSSAPWLSVTPAGAVGSALDLAADAAALAEGLHLATVTVRANVAGVGDETVRVGLYKSSAAAASQLLEPLAGSGFPPGVPRSVSDPVRPLAYMAVGDTVAAQHFHTGQRVGTLTLPGGLAGEVAISDDGRRLYVLDAADAGITLVDLDTFQVAGRLAPSNAQHAGSTSRMVFARVAGAPVLVLNQGYDATGMNLITPVIDADSGGLRGSLRGYNGWSYTHFVAASCGVVYAADRGITGGGLQTARIQLLANSLGRVYNTVAFSPPENVASTMLDMAVHPDGSRAYQSYYGNATFKELAFDGALLSSTGTGPPNPGFEATDVEFLADGRYVAVTGDRLRLYATGNVQLFEWVKPASGATILDSDAGTLRVSADGLRLLGNNLLLDLPP